MYVFINVGEFWLFLIALQLLLALFGRTWGEGASNHLSLISSFLRTVMVFYRRGANNSSLFGSEYFSTPVHFLLLDGAVQYSVQ